MHGRAVMTAGWFQGRQLQFNDTVSSRCVSVAPHNPTAPPQPASEGSSSGKVVDFPMLAWWGCVLMDGGATHRSWALLESDNRRMGVKGPGPFPCFDTSRSSRSSASSVIRVQATQAADIEHDRQRWNAGSRSLHFSSSCSLRSWRRAWVVCFPTWRRTKVLNRLSPSSAR